MIIYKPNEFENKIKFLLNLDGKYKEPGLLNAFWEINRRIKDLEDYKIGEYYKTDKYFGFGFKYDISKNRNGLAITTVFIKSQSFGKLRRGDVILIDSDEELTIDYAEDFMKSKINESTKSLNKPVTLTVFRNDTDILYIDIPPEDVQPNYYSEYTCKRDAVSYLISFLRYLIACFKPQEISTHTLALQIHTESSSSPIRGDIVILTIVQEWTRNNSWNF